MAVQVSRQDNVGAADHAGRGHFAQVGQTHQAHKYLILLLDVAVAECRLLPHFLPAEPHSKQAYLHVFLLELGRFGELA